MLFKNYPSPSPRRLKVPVNRGLQAFPEGTDGFWRFTSLSQNLHLTFTRSWWKIGERYVKANSGCGLAEMPLYRAFALMLVKVKDTFRKVPARAAPPRLFVIYALETDWYLCVLACPSHETAVYATNSLENFVRISCSRQKVVRLFQKWYHFSESPTTFSRISCSHCSLSYSRQKVLPLFRIIATSIVLAAVPIARNAHYAPEHNFLSAGMFSISILIG